jgi:hypothetical protein
MDRSYHYQPVTIRKRPSAAVVFQADVPRRHEGEQTPILEIVDDSRNPERQCIASELTEKMASN